jgi:hypothetical protein
MRMPTYLLLSALIVGFMVPSSWAQLITNTPSLTGPGLPAGFTHNVRDGSGYASVGAYQGRDSLLIGTTGPGDIYSWVIWDLASAFSGPVSEGVLKFSLYDAYGAASPYYVHVDLDENINVAGFLWYDSGGPTFSVYGPNLNTNVWAVPRSIGWQDFEVTWNSSVVSIKQNGFAILNTTLKTNSPPTNVEFGMHNYNRGSQQMALSGFSVVGVPEPSTYALLAMTAAGALWWARRRR